MEEKEFVRWDDVQKYIEVLAHKLDSMHLSGVYGIPRGGCVLAVMLSYKLGIPLLMAPLKNCVVIDDIADTGKTLLHYKEKNDYYITTMFYHKQSLVVPDFWYAEKKDNWIIYPWEGEK
jgi:hypoxanthine phosphoribosyltransferase